MGLRGDPGQGLRTDASAGFQGSYSWEACIRAAPSKNHGTQFSPLPSPRTMAPGFLHGVVSKVNTEQTPKIAKAAKKADGYEIYFNALKNAKILP